MSPEAFWILAGLIAFPVGCGHYFWATTRHDGVEPERRQIRHDPPSHLVLSVMEFAEINYAQWLNLSRAEQSDYINRYFTHKGL